MADLADAINAIKSSYDAVQQALTDARDQLARTKQETKKWDDLVAEKREEHGRLTSQLAASKRSADDAAAEAARRIALNNSQVAELERIRVDLDKREKAVAGREAAADAVTKKFDAAGRALDARESRIADKEQEINRRYTKMKEAVS